MPPAAAVAVPQAFLVAVRFAVPLGVAVAPVALAVADGVTGVAVAPPVAVAVEVRVGVLVNAVAV